MKTTLINSSITAKIGDTVDIMGKNGAKLFRLFVSERGISLKLTYEHYDKPGYIQVLAYEQQLMSATLPLETYDIEIIR